MTPPQSEEDKLNWLRLLRSRRVGPTTFYRLMAEHGDAAGALAALPEIARAAGVEDYRPCPVELAENELCAARLAGARMIARGMPEYPDALTDLADAPPFFWALGRVQLLRAPAIALVGARNASSLGTRMARSLAAEIGASGHVVVSGLARGVDAAAHVAALETGTVAVMAGGVDVVYPAENAVLAQEIEEKGLRISEQPMGQQPQARHFPRRNRLISGLARAVVVVEAAARSGSLITARDALDQGREVMAVPGHPFDARAAGCNMLLRDGAILIRGAHDVLEALAALPPAQRDAALSVGAKASAEPVSAAPATAPDAVPASAGAASAMRHPRRLPATPDASPGPRQAPAPAAPVVAAAPAAKGATAAPAKQVEPVAPVEQVAPVSTVTEAGAGDSAPAASASPRNTPVAGAAGPDRRSNGAVGGAERAAPFGTVPQAGPVASGSAGVGRTRLRTVAVLHRQILDRLGPSPLAEDQLIRDLGLAAATVAPELTALELDGKIERLAGGFLTRPR